LESKEAAETVIQPSDATVAASLAGTQETATAARERAQQQQRLTEAVGWCEQALAANPLDPALHYQLAVLAIEQGTEENAIRSLRNALFLDPNFVMAYVTWGELAERTGRKDEAARHFTNAARLLHERPPDELVNASAVLTVGALLETLQRKHTAGGTSPLA
jgi:chemotaxis protein methyltransferase CheR